MTRFKLDENIPETAKPIFASFGHDVETVVGEQLGGHPDSDILHACVQERRALVTLDLDFADIRSYPPADYPGIIVLRLARLDRTRVFAAIRRLLPLLQTAEPSGELWIVDESTIRIRR